MKSCCYLTIFYDCRILVNFLKFCQNSLVYKLVFHAKSIKVVNLGSENFSNPHFSKGLTYEKTGKVKKYSVTTIVLTFTVWIKEIPYRRPRHSYYTMKTKQEPVWRFPHQLVYMDNIFCLLFRFLICLTVFNMAYWEVLKTPN